MKLLYAGMMALFAVVATPQIGHAAVYAAHLAIVDNGNGTYDLSYRLNEEANEGVTINIKDSTDAVVRTITGNPTAKGLHTVQWDGKNDSNAAVSDGTYTWEVVASTNNTGSDAYVKTGDGTQWEHTFYIPYTIAFDKTTTSPHFGSLYIGNRGGGAVGANGRVTENGIYVLSNDLEDFTGQSDTAYSGGASAGLQYPFAIDVATNGEVFIADYTDANSNVFVMDPDNMTGDFSRLFSDDDRATDGLNAINGSIHSLYVEGEGENRVLYTLDEDMESTQSDGLDGSNGWRYDIGETTSGYDTPPVKIFDNSDNDNPLLVSNGEIHKDTNPNRSGWFVSQYRWAETEGNPNVFHFDGTTVDWKSFVDFNFWLDAMAFGSFDLNADSTRLVAAGYSWIVVADISDLDNMNDNSVVYDDTGVGNSHRDIRFDAAENFAVVSNNTEQLLYYSKQGQNTFTTPNPVGAEIVIGASVVPGWELY